jgi:hypothetical protein
MINSRGHSTSTDGWRQPERVARLFCLPPMRDIKARQLVEAGQNNN